MKLDLSQATTTPMFFGVEDIVASARLSQQCRLSERALVELEPILDRLIPMGPMHWCVSWPEERLRAVLAAA